MKNLFARKSLIGMMLSLMVAAGCDADASNTALPAIAKKPLLANPPDTQRLVKNIRYRPAYLQCIGDLYRPQASDKPLPAVIVVHGGAWRSGDKENFDCVSTSLRLMHEHFVVFNINYRLTTDGGEFPSNVVDVKHAIAYLKDNAAKYSIDDKRIGIYGASAGGHLALMAAYAPNSTFDTRGKNIVKAVVAFCPLTDLKELEVAFVVQYIGCMVDQCKDIWNKASPITYVKTSVPTLLVHGCKDRTVPFEQSTALVDLLKLNHTKVEMLKLPHSDHFFSIACGEDSTNATNALVQFFKENL